MSEQSAPMFEIRRAERKGQPALVGLWGPSSSGKTYTALLIARGLVGPSGKVGVIDTENRRAEFYAGLGGDWDHLDLQPPFTPDRYTFAFNAFAKAGGYGCIIVDSLSHVWEGEGGVLDLAEHNNYSGLKKWQAPKMAYKRMVNNLLRAPFHVIFCLRVKDGVKQVGGGQYAKIENVGAQPICGKGFIYETTVSALLGPDHCPVFPGPAALIHPDPLIPSLKAPEDLKSIFKEGQPLGIDTGKKIAAWVAGGAAFDFDTAKLAQEARDVASMGREKFLLHWKGLSSEQRDALRNNIAEFQAIASAADAEQGDGFPADNSPTVL